MCIGEPIQDLQEGSEQGNKGWRDEFEANVSKQHAGCWFEV